MQGHLVQDQSAHRHFTQIPNMVIDNRELSHSALRLYLWYKKVCGEKAGGQCYQSLKTISYGCSMHRETAIAARNELEKHKLIQVERSMGKKGSKRITVIILDIWKKNNKKYEAVGNGDSPPKRTVGNGDFGAVGNGDLNKSPLRNKRNSMLTPCGANGESVSTNGRKRKGSVPTKFHHRCAQEFSKVVSSYIKVNCKSDMNEWANQFRLMEQKDQIAREELKRTIKWYALHIGEEWMPEAYSAKAFREKFKKGQFVGAMKRTDEGSDSPTHTQSSPSMTEDERRKIAHKVLKVMRSEEVEPYGWQQEELDEFLAEHGFEAGVVTEDFLCESSYT